MDLNEGSSRSVLPRTSVQNLEPKLLVTPPLSPLVTPLEAPTARRSHRRHSIIQYGSNHFQFGWSFVSSPTVCYTFVSRDYRPPSKISRSLNLSARVLSVLFSWAKKKATGDYYAIKVLKKADMIAKNQITNVKGGTHDFDEAGRVSVRC